MIVGGQLSEVSGQSGACRWCVAPLTTDQLQPAFGRHSLATQSEQARKLLDQLVGFHCIVEHDDAGAPCLPDHPELHISISHCREAVAVAVSGSVAVGIDIEGRRKVDASLMRRVCTGDELAAIEAAADLQMCFLQLWTRKEAVLKCRGTGIRGFGSMVEALSNESIVVQDIDTGLHDVVAAVAFRSTSRH